MRWRTASKRATDEGVVDNIATAVDDDDIKSLRQLCSAVEYNQEPGIIYARASRCRDISAYGPGDKDFPPLHLGAALGHLEAMHTLLKLGARVDAVDRSRRTALIHAVQRGRSEAVRVLVAARADLEARDWLGRTALHYACIIAHTHDLECVMAHRLLMAGASVHTLDNCSYTPAMLAMPNVDLIKHILLAEPRPSPDLAHGYAVYAKGSKNLLDMLAKRGWVPASSRSDADNHRECSIDNNSDNDDGVDDDDNNDDDDDDNDDNTDFTSRSSNDGCGDSEGWHVEGSSLHKAIEVNAVGFVVALLELGEDIDAPNSSGWSPLHMATYLGLVAMVETLIGAGAALGLNHPRCGSTALHLSATEGHVEVAEVLLAATLSSNNQDAAPCRSPRARVAPYSSVIGGDELSSRAATNNGKSWSPSVVVDAMDYSGRRPLHLAAAAGSVGVVDALLRAGADVNSRDDMGRTPLFYTTNASENGDVKEEAAKAAVVKALLKAGASPDPKDSTGQTALHKAVLMPAGEVLKALLVGGASPGLGGNKGFTPLHVACQYDARGTVNALLRAGAVPGHCWNHLLQSPLMVACRFGKLNAAEQLLPRLSARQINMQDRIISAEEGGLTPLLAALLYNYYDNDDSDIVGIVDALLGAGADPTLRASNGLSPLAAVVRGSNTKANPSLGPSLVQALAAAGADVNVVGGSSGFTPLHFACLEGACGEVVQALLDAGADACAPCAGMCFMTPLQLAGVGGNVEAVAVLIERPECGGLNAVGAPPSRATALACAVLHGQTEACRFLLERGADMDLLPSASLGESSTTLSAASLVEMAAQRGHLDAMNLLIQAKIFRDKAEEAVGVEG